MSVILGYLLLATPFVIIFAIGVVSVGFDTVKIFAFVAAAYLMLTVGAKLTSGAIVL